MRWKAQSEVWMDDGYMRGGLVEADHLVEVMHSVLVCDNSSFIPDLTLAPGLPKR